jgi:hypothetical protein
VKRYIKSANTEQDLLQEEDLPREIIMMEYVQQLDISPETFESAYIQFNAWYERKFPDEFNYYYKYNTYRQKVREMVKYMSDSQRESLLDTDIGDIVSDWINYKHTSHKNFRY